MTKKFSNYGVPQPKKSPPPLKPKKSRKPITKRMRAAFLAALVKMSVESEEMKAIARLRKSWFYRKPNRPGMYKPTLEDDDADRDVAKPNSGARNYVQDFTSDEESDDDFRLVLDNDSSDED